MGRIIPRHDWRSLAVTSLLFAAAIAAAVPASARAGPGGTQRFDYKVVDFNYAAKGYVSASRESTGPCVAGVTSTINGFSDSSVGSLSAAPRLGDGDLKIGRRNTRGQVDAVEYVDFRQHGARELSTACEGGQTSMVSNTVCDDTVTSKVEAFGLIKGKVGNVVKIKWILSEESAGGWFPNFVCGATAGFEMTTCRSTVSDLEKLTRRKVRLKFACGTPLITVAPARTGYDRYEALSNVSGVVKLKTTVDRK